MIPIPRPALAAFALTGLTGLIGMPGTGCRREPDPPFDPAVYETPAAEAVVHRLLEDASEARKEAKVGVIVLGERMKDSTPGFRAKFPEAGLQWFSSQTLTTIWVGPVARVVERSTGLQPFQVQVSSDSPRDDGAHEVVAAWAYEDRMLRRRYRATPGPDAHWEVEPLEIIERKPAAP